MLIATHGFVMCCGNISTSLNAMSGRAELVEAFCNGYPCPLALGGGWKMERLIPVKNYRP